MRCIMYFISENINMYTYIMFIGQTSRAFSVLDLPGEKTLKERKYGQGSRAELDSKDLKAELEDKEVIIIIIIIVVIVIVIYYYII